MIVIKGKSKVFTEEEESLIVKMYSQDNISMSKIGTQFNADGHVIKRVLIKHGVEVDSNGKRKNNYIIQGNIAKIELKRRNKESIWTIVDTEDLEKILSFKYSWHSGYRAKTKSYYAITTVQTGEKINGIWGNYTLYLQQFLLGYEGEQKVDIDHRNHDTLDNRKENLRVSFREHNSKNRNGRNKNNTTGYRNVQYIESYTKHPYIVRLQINGKGITLGKFSDVDEAGAFAEKMRRKYYKEFAGENDRVI